MERKKEERNAPPFSFLTVAPWGHSGRVLALEQIGLVILVVGLCLA